MGNSALTEGIEMRMDNKDFNLALNLATLFGTKHNIPSAIEELDTGVYLVYYASDKPPIRIENGRMVWPTGSDLDLMLSFLAG